VIVSPTFPPEEKYDILISVETPVAKSPFEAHANDLPVSIVLDVGPTRRDRSSLRLFRHGGFPVDLYDVSQFAFEQ
jgi:hypothetical protein